MMIHKHDLKLKLVSNMSLMLKKEERNREYSTQKLLNTTKRKKYDHELCSRQIGT